jgi:hypothetical protein
MGNGFNIHADLLTKTKDGRDLNALWADYQAVLADYNAQRQTLVDFLSYPVTDAIVSVPVIGAGGSFERATEFGVPKGIRPGVSYLDMGVPFDWFDLAARMTWMFLADATQQQVDAIQNAAIEADSQLVFRTIMTKIFDNTNSVATIAGNPYNSYAFWNNDGNVPPPYRTSTFLGTHTHYTTTNGTVLEADDFDDLIDNVTEHGYTKALGYRLVVMINKAQSGTVRSFRSAASNTTPGLHDATHGDWDFIPASGTASALLPRDVVLQGQQVANSLNGLNVIGSYGDVLVVQDDYMPAGYLFAFATGGQAALNNPIGFRQHANPSLQGMRLIAGPKADYPLIESYYMRGFGVGVLQRGAGAVMQVVNSATYTPPTTYTYL